MSENENNLKTTYIYFMYTYELNHVCQIFLKNACSFSYNDQDHSSIYYLLFFL